MGKSLTTSSVSSWNSWFTFRHLLEVPANIGHFWRIWRLWRLENVVLMEVCKIIAHRPRGMDLILCKDNEICYVSHTENENGFVYVQVAYDEWREAQCRRSNSMRR